MTIVSAIVRLLVGAVFGLASYIVLSPAMAALMKDAPAWVSPVSLLVVIAFVATIGIRSRSIKRAFGWGFLVLGLCTFALPLSTMLLAGRVGMEQVAAADVSSKAASVVGSGIAGAMLTGAASIIGFFLGAVFLILALVLLLTGRREVILVDRETGREVRGVAASLQGSSRGRIEPPLQ